MKNAEEFLKSRYQLRTNGKTALSPALKLALRQSVNASKAKGKSWPAWFVWLSTAATIALVFLLIKGKKQIPDLDPKAGFSSLSGKVSLKVVNVSQAPMHAAQVLEASFLSGSNGFAFATTDRRVLFMPDFQAKPDLMYSIPLPQNPKAMAQSSRDIWCSTEDAMLVKHTVSEQGLLTCQTEDLPGTAVELAVNPAKDVVYCGLLNGEVGSLRRSLYHKIGAQENAITVLREISSGETLLSGDLGGNLCVWDLAGTRNVLRFSQHGAVKDILFIEGESKMFSAGKNGIIYTHDFTTGKSRATAANHGKPVEVLALSPDGSKLLAGGWDCSISCWAVGKGREVLAFDALSRINIEEGTGSTILALRFIDDGHRVLAATSRGWIAEISLEGLENKQDH